MYDVIVIGARVAGASTAMLLAKKGMKVLLIDKSPFPSDTTSTLMIQPRGVAYLYRWGLISKLKPLTPFIKSCCITQENISIEATISPFDLNAGLQKDHGWHTCLDGTLIPIEWMMVRRKILDSLLINESINYGAEFRDKYKACGIIFENNKYYGVEGISFTGKRDILRSKFVVIADGRNSTMMKSVKAKTLKEHTKAEFCFYNYYEGLDSSTLKLPVHKRGRYAIAYGPTNENLHLVSIWGPTSYSSDFFQNPVAHFQKVIKFCYPELANQLENCVPAEEYKRIYNMPNIMREVTGPGWLAVGDAACSLTQTTAIGISNAFRDAELASQYLSQVGSTFSFNNAMKEYSSKHFDDLENYFDYVCRTSECLLPKKNELALLYALKNNPSQAEKFIAVRSRALPVSSFFSPQNIETLLSTINIKEIKATPLMKNFKCIMEKYNRIHPWEWTE